jgi:hypothetical protein
MVERRDRWRSSENNVASVPTVAAVWAGEFDSVYAGQAEASVASIAGLIVSIRGYISRLLSRE